MNLCPAPQISEHCPTKIVGRLIIRKIWFIRPGIASLLTPRDGIVHEWITSFEEINIRIGVKLGMIKFDDEFSSRIRFELRRRELNFKLERLKYSYVQYHCSPIVLIDMSGFKFSSIR